MKPGASTVGAIAAAVAVVGVTAAVISLANAFESIDDTPEGPGSGEEIDLTQPEGPGSGEEIDLSEPEGPGSGEEIDLSGPEGPGSGEEIDLSVPEGPGSGEEEAAEPPGPGSGEELDETYFRDLAKSSCNAIPAHSTCLEYIGSSWADVNSARARCVDGGIFAAEPCPRPTVGGCRIGADSAFEFITWFYGYGGDPFSSETVSNGSEACTTAGGMWVYAP
jgi:hypothetical protein